MTLRWSHVDTVLGRFLLVARDGHIVRILLPGSDEMQEWQQLERRYPGEGAQHDPHDPVLLEAGRQIDEYAAGSRQELDFPIRIDGTPFQTAVWQALRGIRAGEVWSYADVAAAIGKPGAARAVGQANRSNPLPLVVPCHRVVTAQGTIGGYMGRAHSRDTLKAKFLELEGVRLG